MQHANIYLVLECLRTTNSGGFITLGKKSEIPSRTVLAVFAYNLLKNQLCKPVVPYQTGASGGR